MKKNLPLYILLVFLVLMNGFFLIKHFNKKSNHSKTDGSPTQFIAKQLEFNNTQLIHFENFENQNKETMRKISMEIKELKGQLFDLASKNNTKFETIDSITTLIGLREKDKDLAIYKHFQNILSICNETQKSKFTSIVKDAMHRGFKNRKPHGPPPEHGTRPGGPPH